MKSLFKRIVAFVMAFSMLIPMGVAAAVGSTTDVTEDSTEVCNVSVMMDTGFTVTIPRSIVLEADSMTGTGTGDYEVTVKGSINLSHCIKVEPDSSFIMESSVESLTATVEQDVTLFKGSEFGADTPAVSNGNVTVTGLHGGEYNGSFNFYIADVLDPEHEHEFNESGYCDECGQWDPEHEHHYNSLGKCRECGAENPNAKVYTVKYIGYSSSTYFTETREALGIANNSYTLTGIYMDDRSCEDLFGFAYIASDYNTTLKRIALAEEYGLFNIGSSHIG